MSIGEPHAEVDKCKNTVLKGSGKWAQQILFIWYATFLFLLSVYSSSGMSIVPLECMMVGPVFVVLIIHRHLLDNRNSS